MEVQNNTITKEGLMELGYKEGTAKKAIYQAKQILIKQGYTFYANKRLGRVPKSTLSALLGVEL